MSNAAQHVSPVEAGWRVRRAGAERASKVYPTQEAAMAALKQRAKAGGMVIYLHGHDGLIRQRIELSPDTP